MPLGLTQAAALLILFLVMPFAVAAGVLAFVSWRAGDRDPPVRISDVLANGEQGRAEVLSVSSLGTPFDVRPMVRIALRVTAGRSPDPFELEVTQSLPRRAARRLRPGDIVDVRLTADHQVGAVVPPGVAGVGPP